MKNKIAIIFLIIFISSIQVLYAGDVKKHPFSGISFKKLSTIINIQEKDDEGIFKKWVSFPYEVNKDETEFLSELIKRNKQSLRYYSEEELKAKFIFPLAYKIDFDLPGITSWYERKLDKTINDTRLSGHIDCMIAGGIQEPDKPYWFIQEFKQSTPSKHPLNQLLAEMFVAMTINESNTMRGAFIIGENWKFVILKKIGTDYHYYISRQFNCLNIHDLKQIYINLQAIKNLVKNKGITRR